MSEIVVSENNILFEWIFYIIYFLNIHYKIVRNNNTPIFASYVIWDPVADELNLMLCTLNHIKAPLVWAVCGLPLRDGRGRRKQISFLDLGPSFPSTLHPSSSLPFIWPLQGSAGWQHASVVLHSGDIFRWEAHIGLTCIVRKWDLWVQFKYEVNRMWSKWLPAEQKSCLWCRAKKNNFKLEIRERGKKRSLSSLLGLKQAHAWVNIRR